MLFNTLFSFATSNALEDISTLSTIESMSILFKVIDIHPLPDPISKILGFLSPIFFTNSIVRYTKSSVSLLGINVFSSTLNFNKQKENKTHFGGRNHG